MRNSIKLVCLFCLFLLSFLVSFVPTNSAYALSSSARACAVLEANSSRLIYAQNADKRLPMASTTKIMTAITAIENCDELDKKFEVSKKAVGIGGTSLYLREGDVYSTKDLLYALMLISGNDASVAIAEHVAGSTSEFVTKMNELAKKIGVKNTHFANTHGLDADGHYTSAYDLARITAYALKNPIFREIVSTKNTKIVNGNDENRYLRNKNKLLFTLENCIGVKTGFTDNAGRCLVSAVDKDGMILVCVVLNCGPMFEESATLLKECENSYKMYDLTELYDFQTEIFVENGAKTSAKVGTKGHFFFPLTKNEVKNLRFVYHCPQKVEAPMKKGDSVGKVETFLGNNLLFSEKIYTIDDIKPRSLVQRMKDFFRDW